MSNNKINDAIKQNVDNMVGAVTWEYKEKKCGIDPISNDKQYDVWCGDTITAFSSVDEVMNAPFFDGKTISEIIPEMKNLDGI